MGPGPASAGAASHHHHGHTKGCLWTEAHVDLELQVSLEDLRPHTGLSMRCERKVSGSRVDCCP